MEELVNKEGHKLFKLQEPNTYSGTLISIRVSNERKEVNLYEYLNRIKISEVYQKTWLCVITQMFFSKIDLMKSEQIILISKC